jgi:hypothetical protein
MNMLLHNTILGPWALLTSMLGLMAACSDPAGPAFVAKAGASEEVMAPRAGVVTFVTVPQTVPAGTPIALRHLRRHHRSATEVATRAGQLVAIMIGSPQSSSELGSWSEASLGRPYVATTATPIAQLPELVLDYTPHTDSLSLTRNVSGPDPVDLALVRTTAETHAKSMMLTLAASGLADGKFVLARSGSIVVSIRGQAPYNRAYVFEYFRVVDGFIVNNSSVEIRVGRDYEIERIKIRDVEVLEAVEETTTRRSSDAVASDMRLHIAAEIGGIAPELTPDFAAPVASYHLQAHEDEGVVAPEVMMRWTGIGANGSTSLGRVSALGFSEGAELRQVHPLPRPLLCQEFEVGGRIHEAEDRYLVDQAYVYSFVDARDPFGRCEHGNIHSTDSGAHHELREVLPTDAMYHLGLRSGDRDLELCDEDPSSSSYRKCIDLVDYMSFATALGTMLGSARFSISFERDGTIESHMIELVECPIVNGNADCSAL